MERLRAQAKMHPLPRIGHAPGRKQESRKRLHTVANFNSSAGTYPYFHNKKKRTGHASAVLVLFALAEDEGEGVGNCRRRHGSRGGRG
jgi:hypothetical protein